MIIEVNSSNFEQEVLQSKIPVLVDFYADWCPPCKLMLPVITELDQRNDGTFKIVKCKTQDVVEYAQKYKVFSIPTLILFKEGEPVGTIQGFKPLLVIEEFVTQHVS